MNMHRILRPLLLASILLALTASSFAGVFFSVTVAPPPLPVYEQPLCPGVGYIWTPGYWSWGDDGYFWVPGTWVLAPRPGFLWTPGYWGWSGGVYVFNAGYWGPHVGYYGGINYGFGYVGRGYEGGEWRGNNFYYNRTVNNVNVTNVTNVYNKTVIVNNNNHVAYNGPGGVQARPTATEQRFQHEQHLQPTQTQQQHMQEAGRNPQLFAKNNGGKPAIAATARPADFHSATPARAAGGRVNPATLNATPKSMPAAHANANVNARANTSVPRPPNASASTHGNASVNTNTSRNVPRPSNAGSSNYGNNAPVNTSRNASRPSSATQPTHYNSAPPPRTTQRESAPVHSAPQPQQHASAPHESAPAHSAPQREEKPKR